jgi:hypothetical protein
VDETVPNLPDRERQVWMFDQTINDRGVRVDLATIDKLLRAVEMAFSPSAETAGPQVICAVRVGNPTQSSLTLANSKESNADSIKAALYAATQVQQLADEARHDLDGLAQRKAVDIGFSASLGVVRATIKRAESIYDAQLGSK